ncbi:hypothetical protein EMCRGX_G022860 [Ephydatia muelleri]
MAMPPDDWCLVAEEQDVSVPSEDRRHCQMERANVISVTKLCVKALMETSLKQGKALQDDHPQLVQLLLVLELALKHRLKAKRTLLGQRRTFWTAIEAFEKMSPDFGNSVENIRNMPGIRTFVGRGRAWLRLVVMQKKMADFLLAMASQKAILRELYDVGSVMLSDEASIICGMLVGLNSMDYNVMMKGEDFDRTPGVLDLALYLSDSAPPPKPVEEKLEQGELTQLLDQKCFLEEMNRKLETSLERCQSKLQASEETSSALAEKVQTLINQVSSLTSECDQLKRTLETSTSELQHSMGTMADDKKLELETLIQSRAGLNDMYLGAQRSLEAETRLRQQTEHELSVLRAARDEKEGAMVLLEKSLLEKQETVTSLRKQLEELKDLNLKMQNQLKTSQELQQRDTTKIKALDSKVSQLTTSNRQLEKDLEVAHTTMATVEQTCKDLGARLQEVQLDKNTAETNYSIEKQWRIALQADLQREKDRVVELTSENREFKALKKEHAELQEKYACLQDTTTEQEMALVELGKQLSASKQKLIDIKEQSQGQIWQDSNNIEHCQLCSSVFSVAKRKHHCRSCGGVFCHSCSEKNIQLASSSKPVRVCDGCYTTLSKKPPV